MNLTIRTLSPALLNDYLRFFDGLVFTENPGWSACFCHSFHFTGTSGEWTRENNRTAVAKNIMEGRMKGYLAYDGDRPVGWCNSNDRDKYESLSKYFNLPESSGEKVCSVVCFVISPEYRRKGIARKLLERVCIDYASPDWDCLEAYPGKGELSCEGHYKGPLHMYLDCGFSITKEHESYYVVRKFIRI